MTAMVEPPVRPLSDLGSPIPDAEHLAVRRELLDTIAAVRQLATALGNTPGAWAILRAAVRAEIGILNIEAGLAQKGR